jgi:hypothetical protein
MNYISGELFFLTEESPAWPIYNNESTIYKNIGFLSKNDFIIYCYDHSDDYYVVVISKYGLCVVNRFSIKKL